MADDKNQGTVPWTANSLLQGVRACVKSWTTSSQFSTRPEDRNCGYEVFQSEHHKVYQCQNTKLPVTEIKTRFITRILESGSKFILEMPPVLAVPCKPRAFFQSLGILGRFMVRNVGRLHAKEENEE